jgi:hypothetical protein
MFTKHNIKTFLIIIGIIAASVSSPLMTQAASGSTPGCAATVATTAAAQRAVLHAQSRDRICLASGTYDTFNWLSTRADSPVTLAAVSRWQAHIPGITVATKSGEAAGNILLDGLDVNGSGPRGDCVRFASEGRANVGIINSSVQNCRRDGIRFTHTPSATNHVTGATIKNNYIRHIGGVVAGGNGAGNAMTVYADNAVIEDNDFSDGGNDFINAWGTNMRVVHNYAHDWQATPSSNHPDFFQTWQKPSNASTGKPVTNLLISRNSLKGSGGPDTHFMIGYGSGMHNWTITDNLIDGIGGHAIILGKSSQSGSIINAAVARNTFVNLSPSSNPIEFNNASTGKIVGNIFDNRKPPAIGSGASVVKDYNLARQFPLNEEAHGMGFTSPDFVSGNDYHIRSASPARNSGDNGRLVPVRAVDLDGTHTTGVVDRGALEHR